MRFINIFFTNIKPVTAFPAPQHFYYLHLSSHAIYSCGSTSQRPNFFLQINLAIKSLVTLALEIEQIDQAKVLNPINLLTFSVTSQLQKWISVQPFHVNH